MGILNTIEQRAEKIDPLHPRDPALARFFGIGTATSSGIPVTPEKALAISTVFACVKVISETIASLPVHVFRSRLDGGKDRDRGHSLNRLLALRPNRWQTAFEWFEMSQAHVELRGNAYSEIIENNSGRVTELMPHHPDNVTPFRAPDGSTAFNVISKGVSRVLLQHEMLHVKGLGFDGLRGLSTIETHRETMGANLAAHDFGSRFFSNDASPRGVLEVPQRLKNDEAMKRLKESWQAAQTGTNRHKIAVLEDGMKFTKIGLSQEDAQFIETLKHSDVEIARIFRVPPHKVGILDRATFSNIEQQAIEFVTDSMLPRIRRWEQALNLNLLSEAEQADRFIAFVLEGLLRGDTLTRFRSYAIARQWGWLSANDIRRLENMNPIDEGGDVYLSPTNMTPSEMLASMISDGGNGNA